MVALALRIFAFVVCGAYLASALWMGWLVELDGRLKVGFVLALAALAGWLAGLAVRKPGALESSLLATVAILVGVGAGFAVSRALGYDPIRLLDVAFVSVAGEGPRAGNPHAPIDVEGALAIPPESRSLNQAVAAMKGAGIPTVRYPTSKFLIPAYEAEAIDILPLSGIAATMTVNCIEGDQRQFPVARSDRHGFNNEDTVYAQPGPRVMLLGDSYIYGQCVHQEQTIAGQLRRAGVPAVSAALGGNSPMLMLATLREFGPALAPRLVVWFHFDGRHLEDLEREDIVSPRLMRYLDPNHRQGLVDRQSEVDAFWRRLYGPAGDGNTETSHGLSGTPRNAERAGAARVRSTIAPWLPQFGGDAPWSAAESVRLLAAIVARARDEAQRNGAQFLFVPIRSVLSYRTGWEHPGLRPLLVALDQAGVEVADVDRDIRRLGPERFFPSTMAQPHLNAAGYALMARAVAEKLEARRGIRILSSDYALSCRGFPVAFPNVNIVQPGNATAMVAGSCNGKDECRIAINNDLVGGEPADGCGNRDFRVRWACLPSGRQGDLHVPPPAHIGRIAEIACPAATGTVRRVE